MENLDRAVINGRLAVEAKRAQAGDGSKEARKIDKELEQFMRLIAAGKAPESALVKITRREERLKEIEREQQRFEHTPTALNMSEIRVMCGERLSQLRSCSRPTWRLRVKRYENS
jgi:hypothetical protein